MVQSLRSFPKRRVDVTTREVDGQILILDRRHDDVHQLNTSASYVWQCCTGQMSAEEIAMSMAQNFSIDQKDAERDVADLISQLTALDLLEKEADDKP